MSEPVEVKKQFFITHIGHVTVNNYGAVVFEANVQTPVGLQVREGQPAKVIVDALTIRDLARGVRGAIAEMRKEGVYAR